MVLFGSSHSHPLVLTVSEIEVPRMNIPFNVPLVESFNFAEEFMLQPLSFTCCFRSFLGL